jgi:hypothetical protein
MNSIGWYEFLWKKNDMLPLRRACQTVGYACKEKIYLASLGKHRNSLQSHLRSRISFFFKGNHIRLLIL